VAGSVSLPDLVQRIQIDTSSVGGSLESLKKFGTSAAGVATAGVAIGVAVAGGLYKVGEAFDGAYDKIRVGTGATGSQLESLKGSFKSVVQEVPASFDDASTAIADINTRLGLTGAPLESLSAQFLELSRITGTDVSGNIEAVTGLFNNFGISAEDQGPRLDQLFRASQATGISVQDLASKMSSGGVALRAVGMDFEQSAALIAGLSKAGLDASDVMPALNKSLAAAAREGKSANEVFNDTMTRIKGAGSEAEASAIAMETFGAKGGPKLAALIREGKLSMDDLVNTIANGTDTVRGAGEDTADFGEKWQMIKNKVLVALEPIAMRVFDGIGQAMDKLPGILDAIGGAFEPLRPIFSFIGDNIVPILGAIGVALAAVAGPAIIGAIGSLGGVFAAIGGTLAALFSPVVLIVGAIAALVAGLIYAYQHFEGFRNVVDSVIGFIVDTIWPAIKQFASWLMDGLGVAVKAIGEVISDVWKSISDWTKEHWPQIQEAVTHVWNVISTVVSTYITIIMTVIKIGFEIIKTIVTTVLDFIQSFWSEWGDTIMTVVSAIWDSIRAYIEMVINIISGIIEFVLAIINGDWGAAWEAIKGILVAVWDFMKAALVAAWDIIKALFSAAIDFVKSLWENGWEYIKTALGLVWDGIKALVGLAIDWVKEQISNWLEALKFLWDNKWELIKLGLQAIWDGIKSLVGLAIDFVKGIISAALDTIKAIWDGAWDTIKNAASNAWNAIKDGVTNGINAVIDIIRGLPGRIRDFVGDVLSAGAAVGGALLDGVKNAITGAVGLAGDLANGIVNAVKSAWNAVADMINGFVPDEIGWGRFSLDLPDNPIPKFYARGGIVTQATQAIVGEAGPEAIIPLTDLRRARAVMRQAGVGDLLGGPGDTTTNYTVNVYPAQATVDEAYLERLLRRREVLAR